MVEVGAASVGETTQFAISKGGVWVVPRGKFAQSFDFRICQLAAQGSASTGIWTAVVPDFEPATSSELTRQQMAVTHRFRHRLTSQSGICTTSRPIKDVVVQTPCTVGERGTTALAARQAPARIRQRDKMFVRRCSACGGETIYPDLGMRTDYNDHVLCCALALTDVHTLLQVMITPLRTNRRRRRRGSSLRRDARFKSWVGRSRM